MAVRPRRGFGGRKVKRKANPETLVQRAVLEVLMRHRRVAWAHRMNTGAAHLQNEKGDSRFVRFAFKGCSDIIGQMTDGRFLAVECKAKASNPPTQAQQEFLDAVNGARGFAFVASSAQGALDALTEDERSRTPISRGE